MSNNVLRMENITMQFGGVVAVNNLNLEVNQGEIVALIGPNGAGKTTAFNVVTGVYEPTNGKVEFMGETIVENYPQGRMTDHRIGLTLYKLDSILNGDLDELVDAIVTFYRAEMLKAEAQN